MPVRSAIGAPCDDVGVAMATTPVESISTITRDELIGALRAGRIVLVDVLSPDSFATRHIPGAINLPVADIARRAPDVLPDRASPIVTYCGAPT
jgi:rhodanese-related sulfurtransferase